MSVRSSVGSAADWITRSYLVWVVILLVALGVVLWIWHKPKVDEAYTSTKVYLGLQQPSPLDDWPEVVPTDPNWRYQTSAPSQQTEMEVVEAPPRIENPPKPWLRPFCGEDWPQCEWSKE